MPQEEIMKASYVKAWWETFKHRLWVVYFALKCCKALLGRTIYHDASKFRNPERDSFRIAVSALEDLDYNSVEYKKWMDFLKDAVDHHYIANKHHPEHWKYGIEEMSSLDRLEMICDWKAATKRHRNGDIDKSFQINKGRFKIPTLIFESMLRDAREIGIF